MSLDRAAAPRVGLDKGGRYDNATDAGALAVLSGTQSHAVPAGVDVSDCGQVYIRCGTFSVPLGIAHLN